MIHRTRSATQAFNDRSNPLRGTNGFKYCSNVDLVPGPNRWMFLGRSLRARCHYCSYGENWTDPDLTRTARCCMCYFSVCCHWHGAKSRGDAFCHNLSYGFIRETISEPCNGQNSGLRVYSQSLLSLSQELAHGWSCDPRAQGLQDSHLALTGTTGWL